ncbi:MAG: ABC transporter ATP-binding protein [Bdellovibrionaceae bacterium]|nr:ABC transporter ATP-binding protein [Pseudobdellovibrionaceae bacterium]
MVKLPLIKTVNLNKTYQMGEVEVPALKKINIELFEGEFVVLLGHSGCGKSTLLNILGGLDRPTEGEIWFDSEALHNFSDRELTHFRRKNIGFIFQMYNLIPRLSAMENVQLVTEISENPMVPERALDLVGLKSRADHFPSQMSGGEQQRVAIARAIAKQPRMLFCDEPTGALDVKTGILVLEAIQKVNLELNTTTVVITHNAAIADMADRVIILVDGQVHETKTNDIKCNVKELKW